MRLRVLFSGLLCALGALPGAVRAQSETCNLPENADVTFANRGTPYETWHITNALFICTGGRRMKARTATYNAANRQLTLEGSVEVDDPERTLRSGYAHYLTEAGHLTASDSVLLTDLRTGSRIRADVVQMFDETPERPESLIIAAGTRPRAVLFQQRPGGAPGDSVIAAPPIGEPRDSVLLDAQEIRLLGEDSFTGAGDAMLTRDSLVARGSRIEYAQETGRLEITGTARVELPRYELRGDSITATVGEDDQLRDVLARIGASLTSEEMFVTAPAILLFFEAEGISRLVAMNWAARAASPADRPRVVARELRLNADSIDVLAPATQLTEAVAIGNAFGERPFPDSLRALLPEADPDVLALISSDWMRGDTVRAFFIANPRAARDTTATARTIDRLAAAGDRAQSMYGIRDEGKPDAKLSFNYVVADRIAVKFGDNTVSLVEAAGDATGVYLQPEDAARQRASGRGTPLQRRRP